jgi:hypothetical protein
VSEKEVPYWPRNVTAPVVLPQPNPHFGSSLEDFLKAEGLLLAGCLCPLGANMSCQNSLCPRKDIMGNIADEIHHNNRD